MGDYTRVLAHQLVSAGHEIALIAIADKYIERAQESKINMDGKKIELLRIPFKRPLQERLASAKRFSDLFEPEWISLQYVPYAFNNQGLPLKFASSIHKLSKVAKKHILIHEAFLDGKLSLKNRIIRQGQIMAIKRLMRHWQPNVVHTTIPEYRSLLAKLDIDARLLGLFGNMPIAEQPQIRHKREDKVLQAVYFGAMPRSYHFAQYGKLLSAFLTDTKFHVKLTFAGKSSSELKAFIGILNENCENLPLEIAELGILTETEVSELFHRSDFGIARVAPKLLGKSGSAISMLEHGLPLWVPLAEDHTELKINFDYRSDQCFHDLGSIQSYFRTFAAESRVREIGDKLVADLKVSAS